MNIRPATYTDLNQIAKLGKKLWDIHCEFDPLYYQIEDNFEELFISWVKEQINSPYNFLFVAENENPNKIVGFISGFIKSLFPWFKIKYVGHISYLIVEENFRRQGIGGKLEKEAVNWFKTKNVPYVEVYTDELNSAGIAAWSSYNYLPFKKFLRKKI